MWKVIFIGVAIGAVVTTALGAGLIRATSDPRPAEAQAERGVGQVDTVVISNDRFQPATIRVEPGTTVTWVNQDDEPHNVVAEDGSWESPVLQKGEEFSHAFSEGGSARYICSLHPWMTGVVLVGDQAAPAPSPGSASQTMRQHMEQMHGAEGIDAMREHMDAMHGEGAFDAMLEQGTHPCGAGGTAVGPGGMMGGSVGAGMMGSGTTGSGRGGGMMGPGGGGMMGW
jgi:plastocyanin